MKDPGDIEVFNRLFSELKGRFTRFAYSYVRDWSIAEDIVNDAFLYYWENRFSVSHDSNIPSYILTVIKHKCLNYLEHLRVKQDAEGQIMKNAEWELNIRISALEACEPSELFNAEVQAIVEKTLRSLPDKSSRIFTMSRYYNKSNKEIAAALKINIKTVESHITKVLKILRQNLRDYFP
jgi:RNA polymerase sigma-70 factor (ECF subfamily)